MQVSIKSNINEFSRHMTWLEKKQIPFATSQAINDVAFEAQRAAKKGMDRHLDNPTPWTKSGVRVKRGKKNDPTATVYMVGASGLPGTGDRNKYISKQVEGGMRLPDKRTIITPTNYSRLNKYGNFTRANRQKLFNDRKNIVGLPNGIADKRRAGIYTTKGRGKLVKLANFVERASYRARYPFYKICAGVVNNQFNKRFRDRLQAALRTAR